MPKVQVDEQPDTYIACTSSVDSSMMPVMVQCQTPTVQCMSIALSRGARVRGKPAFVSLKIDGVPLLCSYSPSHVFVSMLLERSHRLPGHLLVQKRPSSRTHILLCCTTGR